MNTAKHLFAAIAAVLAMPLCAALTEISIDLKMDNNDYVTGERIRGVVKLVNKSPVGLSVGFPDSQDLVFVEVCAASDMALLDRLPAKKPFTGSFRLPINSMQKLEVLLGDHYNLKELRQYLARPVLVHDGMRYEGRYRAFNIVPGTELSKSLQVFSNRNGLQREFRLVCWLRQQTQHLFLLASDVSGGDRSWETRDLGAMMKITPPTLSILPDGTVIVLHRYGHDHFVRSEFWSLPDAIEFHSRELVNDPETAGHSRVEEMYRESGGVKPVTRPWWKIW